MDTPENQAKLQKLWEDVSEDGWVDMTAILALVGKRFGRILDVRRRKELTRRLRDIVGGDIQRLHPETSHIWMHPTAAFAFMGKVKQFDPIMPFVYHTFARSALAT